MPSPREKVEVTDEMTQAVVIYGWRANQSENSGLQAAYKPHPLAASLGYLIGDPVMPLKPFDMAFTASMWLKGERRFTLFIPAPDPMAEK